MNDNTKKMVLYIRNNNYQEFNSLLDSTTDLDYDIIDRELLIKKDFNIQIKISYSDSYKRDKLLKLLEEDILENYIYYNYFSILLFALTKIRNKNRKLVYILKAFVMAPNEKMDVLKRTLENHNFYNEFIKYIKISDSNYLKVKAAVFLTDRLNVELFGSYRRIIDYIKESNLSKKEKIEYLIEVSKKINDKNLLTEIEDLIIQYSEIYYEKLNSELSNLDEEILLQGQIEQEEYIKTVLSVLRDKKDSKSYLYK